MIRKHTIKKIKFAILVLMIIASFSVIFFSNQLGLEDIFQRKDLHNDLPSVLIYIAWMIFAASTTFPISVVLIPGIFVFSFWYAIIFTYIGIVIGALITYYLSMYLGRDFADEYAGVHGERIRIVKSLIEKKSFGVLLVLNAFYFFPSNLAHVVAGLTKTRLSRFLIPTIIANFLNFFFISLLTLGVLENNNTYIYTSIISLILISVIPLIIYRKHLKEIFMVSFGKN